MEDITKSINEKIEKIEKEGTPVRSLATCGRLFIESAYKTAVSTFSPVKAQNLYAERVNLAVHSFDVFRKNNQALVDYCRLYPSTVLGCSIAAVSIPTLFLFRFRTALFAGAATAAVSASAIDMLAMQSVDENDKAN
mmetsp:Transcript_5741/g.9356  ORF Transcript_5741/g.9356 Transcript_5741/m.9356 type:complete len:137 (-) Transcript_5741:225-635(-)|eukprot:CAMPEP_0114424384 /NCGR_PEP_ID=MMETSP0103-20121206/6664_1 /TAXON_ID=37642 ORGANISM="Paraphysomonas imperforata, Strain PA2" /NCGR_SAMPLE_ID=MMETSP0103 /ASSEMBLY_ACC=CAM_ASM_000201 /LENGTH=136 /DNA_ID=CAMNT_0001593131 /DNA_START=64 /DNA_END=474 /DNA_ORIENTATION=-